MTTVDLPMPIVIQRKGKDCLAVDSSLFDSQEQVLLQEIRIGSQSRWRVLPYRKQSNYNFLENFTSPYTKNNTILDKISSEFNSPIQPAVLDNELGTFVFPVLEENNQEEIEETFLRGVQPINHQHKVLFTQKVQLKTSELKRRRPNIVINPILFEDDE
ncbi:MAG: hypothetical protein M3367_13705 [Acidobacteriota bacterium]|nr:hypothetical protein [Acidobacteriota bacterium]